MRDVRCAGGWRWVPANSFCSPGNWRHNPRCGNRTPHARCNTKSQYRWLLNNHKQAPGLELLLCMAQGWCSCRHSFPEHPYRTHVRTGSFLVLTRFFSKDHFGKRLGQLSLHGFFFLHHHFGGVYSKDQLPSELIKDKFYIVNLQVHD